MAYLYINCRSVSVLVYITVYNISKPIVTHVDLISKSHTHLKRELLTHFIYVMLKKDQFPSLFDTHIQPYLRPCCPPPPYRGFLSTVRGPCKLHKGQIKHCKGPVITVQPSMRHHSYNIITSFLFTFGSVTVTKQRDVTKWYKKTPNMMSVLHSGR